MALDFGKTASAKTAKQRMKQAIEANVYGKILELPASKLHESPLNALMPTEEIEELAGSIDEYGLQEPLLVYSLPEGEYEIYAGHRRFLAMRELKKEKIPLIPAKSLFVLKTDAKIEDFYKVLCDSIIEDALSNSDSKQVHKTYEINDVQVDEKKNNKDKSTITLIITLTDKNVDELIDKMFSTDGIGNIKRTNKIKCVLEEDCGSFDLKTIYPTMDTKQYYFTNRNNNVIKEDKSEIYKLYNETFLPERLQAKNSKSLNVLRVDV